MPVFLFAWSQVPMASWERVVVVFVLLHFLVYPVLFRLYSIPILQLKRFPILNFSWKSVFYGLVMYWAIQAALGGFSSEYAHFSHQLWAKMMITFFVGSLILFTQLYQNEFNKRDGIQTMSGMLGNQGSFGFFAWLFLSAEYCAWQHFQEQGAVRHFIVLQFFLLPVLVYSIYWFARVRKSSLAADFDHATRMRLLTSFCLNLCFLSFLISAWLSN
ncbi:MAG TPA: hypothetical protein DIW47_12735 [Bacteroidetes bacterium]|nr:hypothetical protein [Bacteroidota bacterium]